VTEVQIGVVEPRVQHAVVATYLDVVENDTDTAPRVGNGVHNMIVEIRLGPSDELELEISRLSTALYHHKGVGNSRGTIGVLSDLSVDVNVIDLGECHEETPLIVRVALLPARGANLLFTVNTASIIA
jgi:hypothetical protein